MESGTGRPVACVVFGAAAWRCAPRDRWIGWSPARRASALPRVVNNTRFLTFPWVRGPQKQASHGQAWSHDIDPILDKIAAHGIQSLTDAERSMLEDARKRMLGGS